MFDTLLSRYGDMSFIMSLPLDEGIELYIKARDKTLEERVWERWLVDYPRMTKENFKSFAYYLQEIKAPAPAADNRSEEEILSDAENILKSMKRSS